MFELPSGIEHQAMQTRGWSWLRQPSLPRDVLRCQRNT